MKIAYLQKTSLIDYPGKISAIIFTQGCNLRCPYCHNPELIKPELFTKNIPEEEILAFLKKRTGKLDGLVITGGEPSIQNGLVEFMRQVKNLGFLIKLDTNGTMPGVVETVIQEHLADYIAMDIKAPALKYNQISGTDIDMGSIDNSIRQIMNSGIDYEFRTTWASNQLSVSDIIEIAGMIKGAKHFAIQRFKPSKHLGTDMLYTQPPDEAETKKAVAACSNLIEKISIR